MACTKPMLKLVPEIFIWEEMVRKRTGIFAHKNITQHLLILIYSHLNLDEKVMSSYRDSINEVKDNIHNLDLTDLCDLQVSEQLPSSAGSRCRPCCLQILTRSTASRGHYSINVAKIINYLFKLENITI